MPTVQIETADGPLDVFYTISTPALASAPAIDPALPTVIFLHPVYVAQTIFHPQFADPRLRRFNLVAVDSRAHGATGGLAGPTWGEAAAAEDLYKFMKALRLPPCHLFGVSMGACIALQMGIAHPKEVASLFLLSLDPPDEPEDIAAGRQEIADCWLAGFRDPAKPDEVALFDSVYGVCQLGFNSAGSPFVDALANITVPQALANFGPAKFASYHRACVGFFAARAPHAPARLARITAPVRLAHCAADIAHPFADVAAALRSLRAAGVAADAVTVAGAAQFGSVTHPEEVGQLLHDFVLAHTRGAPPPPAPACVTSPYDELLARNGLREGSSDGSSDG